MFHAKVDIYDRQNNSTHELHTFEGIGVTVEMAVQEVAYVAITSLRREHPRLEETGFRYFPYPPAGDDTRRYTAVCTPYVSRRYDPQYMVRYIEVLDRTVRALTVELYATRARHYDTLEQMRPVGTTSILPSFIPYPRMTEMPPGLVWPEVGGDTPARGPLLPPGDQLVHQSRHGMQPPSLEHRQAFLHRQLPDFRGCLQR